jgi:hypothetical protein
MARAIEASEAMQQSKVLTLHYQSPYHGMPAIFYYVKNGSEPEDLDEYPIKNTTRLESKGYSGHLTTDQGETIPFEADSQIELHYQTVTALHFNAEPAQQPLSHDHSLTV